MIRSSALLTAVAMAMLVAGVSAANLGLIYLSIAVSILAAVILAAGVVLRRRELFGEAGAAPQSDQPGSATAETAKAGPVPVRPAARDRVTADRGGRREVSRRDGEQPGDLAARLRKAGSGTAAGTGSARWPASIAAKGAPATARRAGERSADSGRAARSPASRGPAAREPGTGEPARGDWAGRERDGRQPAPREPAAREATGHEPVPTGSTERGAERPPLPGRATGPGRALERGRNRAAAGPPQGPAAARPDREHPAPSRDRGGEEVVGSGSQDPVRPAWPATAGPRAMGTGSAARRAPGETGDEPDGGAGRAAATAEPAAGGAWSAWSSTRTGGQGTGGQGTGDQGTGADAAEAGRDWTDRDAAHDERAAMHATTGAAAGAAPGAASETGAREAEAGVRGDAVVHETADRAEPGGAARSGAERPGGTDDAGETAGGIAEAESAAEPGKTHDAAGTSKAADAGDAGDAGESDDSAGDDAAGADADDSSPLDDEVTAVPGVPRYHRRGCILIRFLSDGDLETTTRRAAETAGSVPCKACQPDKQAPVG